MKQILVVDDEARITQIYHRLLSAEGYGVLEANDCHYAMNLLITHSDIGLMLLDIRLPQIDGVTLYEAAKECDPDIKVIVTSAYTLEVQKERILKADDYYEKTQGLDILLSKIRRVFLSPCANSPRHDKMAVKER